MNLITKIRLNAIAMFAVVVVVALSALPTRAASVLEPAANPVVPQCDPGKQAYVLETFSLGEKSMQVLVTRTASGELRPDKEYWSVNQDMLGALARATKGTSMSLYGVARDWPAPDAFDSTFQMPDTVKWSAGGAPDGLNWVFRSSDGNTFVCLKFNLAGPVGRYSVRSIKWYLAAKSAPGPGTFVFPPGTTYSLYYTEAPTLPSGFSWYNVAVRAEAL